MTTKVFYRLIFSNDKFKNFKTFEDAHKYLLGFNVDKTHPNYEFSQTIIKTSKIFKVTEIIEEIF